jgi:hypothetical protein
VPTTAEETVVVDHVGIHHHPIADAEFAHMVADFDDGP